MIVTTRRRALLGLPFAGATLAGIGFWKMLSALRHGSYDPRAIRNDLRDRTIPEFSLPGLHGPGHGFNAAALRQSHKPIILNFFASWCLPCVAEMAALRVIGRQIVIWGVAYKNTPEEARIFVTRDGSPYEKIALDESGMTSIDWGISGVPESFLILPGGRIAWHGAAALEERIFRNEILPLVET